MNTTRPFANTFSWWMKTVLAVLVASGFGALSRANAQTTGYHDFSFGSTISAPTESKPESKLWFNDGVWWGVLFNPSLQGFDIYRLNLTTQAWTDTGTAVDDRPQSIADALWDQASGKLYIVSNLHVNTAAPNSSPSNWGRLYRYSYNSGTQSYVQDVGFPVTVTKGKEETLTVAKDSTGELWVAYVESSKVMVNHSVGSDDVWGTPFVLPVSATATSVSSDDIASIIAFGGNKIGVFWSNEKTDRDYFAIHGDGNAETTWLPEETAWGAGVNCTGECADDHINLKTDSTGRVFVAAKTSFLGDSDPLIVLLVRSTDGTWSSSTESLHVNTNTRGIVLLDEPHDRLYLFVASTEAGGNILYKSTRMSNPSFVASGQGDIFIDNPTDAHLNNPTSTKQNLTNSTGLLVLASDSTSDFYAHNFVDLNLPIITLASFTPTSGASGTSVVLTGSGFTGATSVKFNGASASFTVNSDTQITTTVPVSATTGPIAVSNFASTGTSSDAFTVLLGAPTITSVSPSSGVVGASVTITGTNYRADTVVAFNGTQATSPVINSLTKITAKVPSGATTGTITVTNSGGTGTSPSIFKVKPVITSFSPTSGAIGAPLTINGTSFTGTTAVKFYNNKSASFTVVSDTQIDTTVPNGTTNGVLKVTTPGGTATSSVSFTVTTTPVITGFTPTSGPPGTQVTISGSNLNNASSVTIAGTAAMINSDSATQIKATVEAPANSQGPIVVTTPGGTADTTSLPTPNFTVVSPPPVPIISSFTPTSGNSGTVVTINGVNFTGTTAVHFNGTSANFTFGNDTQLTATVPAGATTGPISVTNGFGTGDTSSLNPANFSLARVKDITFESGSLTGSSGFGSITGTPSLETASPLKGADSMTISAGTSYGTQTYTSTDEIFLSLYIRLAAIPSAQVRVVRITDAGTSVGALTLETTGKLTLRNGSTSVGATTAALTPGTLYRIGIHQKRGTGSNGILEGFVATGDANFGTAFASSGTQSFITQADSVQIGATTGTVGSFTLDDVRLDTGAMPGPSAP